MADELNSSEDNPTLDDENLEETDEPTRAELKEMLVCIQISIQSILRENKETRREVVQLKETVLEQKTTIASLKTAVVGLEKQCANNEKDLAAARNERSAVSKDGGCPFFALGELRKISAIYSAIFDIFDLNVHVISFSLFCVRVLYDFFTIYIRNAINQGN